VFCDCLAALFVKKNSHDEVSQEFPNLYLLLYQVKNLTKNVHPVCAYINIYIHQYSGGYLFNSKQAPN
jgi:hypothetical protein